MILLCRNQLMIKQGWVQAIFIHPKMFYVVRNVRFLVLNQTGWYLAAPSGKEIMGMHDRSSSSNLPLHASSVAFGPMFDFL